MVGHLNGFFARGEGNLSTDFSKIQMPRVLPGGDVEALIWLSHKKHPEKVKSPIDIKTPSPEDQGERSCLEGFHTTSNN